MIGDTTIVCWAENGEPAYRGAFNAFFDGVDEQSTITNADLRGLMERIASGKPIDWEGVLLKPANRFYILGLAPNAARLSVRFFLQSSFGDFIKNLKAHYDRLEIAKPSYDKWGTIPPWKLFGETVNQKAKDKSPSPEMTGDTLRAILTNGRYPATLLNGVMLRIKAEREVTRGRAAIIKAYLIKNYSNESFQEVLEVELNDQSNYQPYVLGRLFAILEQVQEAASPGINATIRDKYFNSACATPAVIFPLLIKLSGSHLRKLGIGQRIYLERQITGLMGKITESYPARLGLPEQGVFQLGYYHQTQTRYEKKDK
jgi:CRISPR-associated protein Csd1